MSRTSRVGNIDKILAEREGNSIPADNYKENNALQACLLPLCSTVCSSFKRGKLQRVAPAEVPLALCRKLLDRPAAATQADMESALLALGKPV